MLVSYMGFKFDFDLNFEGSTRKGSTELLTGEGVGHSIQTYYKFSSDCTGNAAEKAGDHHGDDLLLMSVFITGAA